MIEESVLIPMIEKYVSCPFIMKIKDREFQVGEGNPVFSASFRKKIPFTDLFTSTSLALGEAYMDGDIEG